MTYSQTASQAMLRKADEKLNSAKDDFRSGRYDSCINNMYYSAFGALQSIHSKDYYSGKPIKPE